MSRPWCTRGPANFVSAASVGEIADAFEALDADDEVRALVFATEGKVFCGGADLTGDKPLADENGESETPRLYRNAVRLFSTRKPVVMAVQGLGDRRRPGLALVGDFRVAAPEARFSRPVS
ncbi:enoyl-CoA hydratase/isomerase family protein [Sphingomonas sp. MMS24-JH45]